jgi:hypothetical protein
MPATDPAAGVHEGIELLVSILEPRLGARGGLVGAKISLNAPSTMSPDEARRLAAALSRAAEHADEVDRKLLPILESYAEARDRLLYEEPA